MKHTYALLARICLSAVFITSGWSKIGGYAGTQQYMDAMGVPGVLLPLVILLELGGGIAILAGLFTRWLSPLFAAFTVVAALLFHADFADQMQYLAFMKNIAIAGGFLALAALGSGAFSLDAWLANRTRGAVAAPARSAS